MKLVILQMSLVFKSAGQTSLTSQLRLYSERIWNSSSGVSHRKLIMNKHMKGKSESCIGHFMISVYNPTEVQPKLLWNIQF